MVKTEDLPLAVTQFREEWHMVFLCAPILSGQLWVFAEVDPYGFFWMSTDIVRIQCILLTFLLGHWICGRECALSF